MEFDKIMENTLTKVTIVFEYDGYIEKYTIDGVQELKLREGECEGTCPPNTYRVCKTTSNGTRLLLCKGSPRDPSIITIVPPNPNH